MRCIHHPRNLLRWCGSLLTVTHMDTWLASSYTRVTIWSILDLSVTSYSSGCSTKLLMQEAVQRAAALERDLFCVASTGAFIHTYPVVSPAAIIFYFTYFTVHARVSCSPTSTSGQLGNDQLTTSSFASKAWNKLSWSFGDVLLSVISDRLVAWVDTRRLRHKLGDRRFRYARDRGTPT